MIALDEMKRMGKRVYTRKVTATRDELLEMRKTMTLKEIADLYGVTRERIRQIVGPADLWHGRAQCRRIARAVTVVAKAEMLKEKWPHGSHQRYNMRKCRCDLCRAANTARCKESRNRNKKGVDNSNLN